MDIIKLSMNLDEMPEYEPLPAGPYVAELRDVEVRYSDKLPNGFLYCQFRIDPSDYPIDYDAANAPDGLNVVYARVQIPDPNSRRTVGPLKQFMKALGISSNSDTFDPNEWVGKNVQLLLSKNVYQGQQVNNVDSVGPVPKV